MKLTKPLIELFVFVSFRVLYIENVKSKGELQQNNCVDKYHIGKARSRIAKNKEYFVCTTNTVNNKIA